jgi:FeS assembly SUF system regulator
MASLAEQPPDTRHNAREIAERTQLPLPVVSKILKALTREGLLLSQRGPRGGYSLARRPNDINVVEMITALEGPIGLTECTMHPGQCVQEANCHVRKPWQQINHVVRSALARVTLAELASLGGR